MLTVCAIFLSLTISAISAAESTGQKAHFQVEDKSGDLKISATKDLAKVTAQADSVQVVVKPGTAEYPVLKSDKPIVHVTQPGWHTLCFRKSTILKMKNRKASNAKRNRKTRISSKMQHPIRMHRKLNTLDISHLVSKKDALHFPVFHRSKQEVSGTKKSDVKFSGFHVSGDAGKLKMHVTKDETTLSSESGEVDISLNKNPSSLPPSSSASKKQAFQTQPQLLRAEPGDKLIHFASELSNNVPYIGLRKSIVGKIQDTKSTDWD